MKLTKKQIKFLDIVCFGKWEVDDDGCICVRNGTVHFTNMNLTEIPVKFKSVTISSNEPSSIAYFDCSNNKLTTLKNCPDILGYGKIAFTGNPLNDYFKNIKEEDFPYWNNLYWGDVLREYPFLINIGKKYLPKDYVREILEEIPQMKIYLE
jgi:hypothetical protein